jgi:hypothetical protein
MMDIAGYRGGRDERGECVVCQPLTTYVQTKVDTEIQKLHCKNPHIWDIRSSGMLRSVDW